MIYQPIPVTELLQQGDIFRNIPRAELSLSRMAIFPSDGEPEETTWDDLVLRGDAKVVTALVGIQPVTAIVISQNCDNARGKDISLCAVESLDLFIKPSERSSNPKKWNNQLLKHAHNPRYFYLPADNAVGFENPMTADFRSVIRLNRKELEGMRANYRITRLNDVAGEHLRESLAQFFRRYPVNEWYPLTKEEAQAYSEEKNLTADELYDWQK